jgi:hypothetical protein
MWQENSLKILAKKADQWKGFILWLAVIAVFFSLLLVVAPGRGAGWIQDDGLFLHMSWNAVNGYGLDRLLPQAPHYLFHALLMKAGLLEFLHFRYVNYIVILVSSLVFFLGLDQRRFKSPVVPVAVCASLLVSLDSIQNPNSLAMAFFMLGAGCYFFSINATPLRRHVLLLLCGFLFAVAGFMHAAVVIAMIVLIGILWFFDRSIRRSFLLPAFLLGSFLLWSFYISALGMESLLAAPGGHDASAGYIGHRVIEILRFYLKTLLIYLLAMWLFRKSKQGIHFVAQSALSVAVTIFCVASLITYLAESEIHFPGWLWVSQLPGAVFLLLLFVLFRWSGERVLNQSGSDNLVNTAIFPEPGGKGWKQNSFDALNRALSELRFNALSRNQIVAVVGLILIQAAVAVGSNTAIIQGMVFFAGPAMGLTIIMWDTLDRGGHVSSRIFTLVAVVWLCILGTISFTYNHPGQSIEVSGTVVMEDPPLRGILEQPRYAAAVKQLGEVYRANGCEKMTMVAFDYIPMVFYILQHPAPVDVNVVVRPSMIFPEERIRSILEPQHGWCVIDVTGVETQDEIERNHGKDKRAALRTWIEQQSDRVITIPSPSSEFIGNVRFIVRDAR